MILQLPEFFLVIFIQMMYVGEIQLELVAHEKADVIMIYHAINEAVAGYQSIRVVSDDADVLVILSHHLHSRTNGIPHDVQFYIESCSRNLTLIYINEVLKKHEQIMSNLLAAHALSGCDSVSSFIGIGKATVHN